jgi:hypothetical protein
MNSLLTLLKIPIIRLIFLALAAILAFSLSLQAPGAHLILDQDPDQAIEEALAQCMIHADPVFFFEQVLTRTAHHLMGRNRLTRERGKAHLMRLKKLFPGVLHFTALTPTGEVIPEWCDGFPPKVVIRRLHGGLEAFAHGDSEPLRKSWKLVKSFLGPDAEPGKVARNQLFQVALRDQKTWMFISQSLPGGVFLCHLSRTPSWKSLGLRYAAARWNARNRAVRLLLIDPRAAPPEAFSVSRKPGEHRPLPSGALKEILSKLERFPIGKIHQHGAWWGMRFLAANLRLVAFRHAPGEAGGQSGKNPLPALVIGIIILLFWAGPHLASFVLNRSVAWKLHVVFFTIALLAMLVLAGGGLRFWRERREFLENHQFQQLEHSLQVFDRRFPTVVREVEAELLREFAIPMPGDATDLAFIQKRLQGLTQQYSLSRLAFMRLNGDIITPQGMAQSIRGIEQMQRAQKQMIYIMKTLTDPLTRMDPGLTRELSAALVGARHTLEDLVAEAKTSFGGLRETSLGRRGLEYHGLFPHFDAKKVCRGLLFLDFPDDEMQRIYLEKNLTGFSRQVGGAGVLALHVQNPRRRYAVHARITPGALRFHRQVAAGNTTLRDQQADASAGMLVGRRGRNVSGYTLQIRSSTTDVDREVAALGRRLSAYAFGLFGVALMISLVLGKQFLRPVRDLTSGLSALRNRDFSFRIPVHSPDELGRLASVFNLMIEDMADLEVAKSVQETLFPTQELRVGDFRVYGSCVSAAQVGGDYLDYRTAPSGRISFFLGDVSGHGIAAAIVMAMVKGVFTYSDFSADPLAGMPLLNQVLTSSVKRKKMMTALLGSLDPETGDILMANAGHVNPLFIRNGEARYLESWGKPLGVSHRFTANPIPVHLDPGDYLLLMTDGIPEATGPNGAQIGYEKVRVAIPPLLHPDPIVTEAAIRSWHQNLCTCPNQEDDITFLLIHREASKPGLEKSRDR